MKTFQVHLHFLVANIHEIAIFGPFLPVIV